MSRRTGRSVNEKTLSDRYWMRLRSVHPDEPWARLRRRYGMWARRKPSQNSRATSDVFDSSQASR
jgi:hypothetical protein